MPTDVVERMEMWASLIQTVFVFAFGACAGSLINVLAYRMPLGISVVTPPSRCPSCNTRLTWRENIPILGWILLRGRCRFCKCKISPEYPIIETLVAVLFAAIYVLWYVVPRHGDWPVKQHAVFLGFDWSLIKPEWAYGGFASAWPIFVMVLVLVGSLVAMTLTDIKTYMIPLQLAWTPAVVGILAHTGWGVYLSVVGNLSYSKVWMKTAPGWTWAIASPGKAGWSIVGAAIGGIVGLGIANVLLSKGLIRRSFADYDEWEKAQKQPEAVGELAAPPAEAPSPTPASTDPVATAAPRVPDALATTQEVAAPAAENSTENPTEMWLEYPHARREMLKELIFLAPCLALAMLGASLAHAWAGPWVAGPTPLSPGTPTTPVPLWLDATTASIFGFLIGGGVVWLVRILGSLAFGKEALGLGDVHMMAGVGACLGWIDATFGFFLSAFVGLAWAGGAAIVKGKGARALPLGPSLAMATMLVLVGKVGIERLMDIIASAWKPWNLP